MKRRVNNDSLDIVVRLDSYRDWKKNTKGLVNLGQQWKDQLLFIQRTYEGVDDMMHSVDGYGNKYAIRYKLLLNFVVQIFIDNQTIIHPRAQNSIARILKCVKECREAWNSLINRSLYQ